MSQALSVAPAADQEDNLAGAPAIPSGKSADGNVSLRGTTRGLEILISGAPSTAELGTRLTELLAEAPSFFAGSSAHIAIEGALPSGALACLEEVATRFEVQIVEISPVAARRRRPAVPPVLRPGDVPQVHLAEGTGPIAEDAAELRGSDPGDAAIVAPPALPIDVAANDASAAAASEAAPPELALSDAAPTEVALASSAPNSAALLAAAPAAAGPSPAGPSDAAPPAAGPSPAGPSDAAPIAAGPSAAAPAGAAATNAAPSAAQPGALASAAADLAAALAETVPPGPRLVIGPVRSGVIVDHTGHVIVIGDVNPGAEVRAEGSIIVLGRLRGVAHAAIGREAGCIIALSLAPQQLRIGRVVARAADADRPSGGAEIAYATGETIVVERFLGRLPSGLAASMQ
jgi:septum site-determining protein MinC